MDQFVEMPTCNEVASSSASVSSPSPTIPIQTQPQTPTETQTPPKHGGLPPLHPFRGRKSIKEKSYVWDHFEKYEDIVEFVKEEGTKFSIFKKES